VTVPDVINLIREQCGDKIKYAEVFHVTTILRIYIQTLKGTGGGSLLLGRYIYTLPHRSNEVWTLVQVDIQS